MIEDFLLRIPIIEKTFVAVARELNAPLNNYMINLTLSMIPDLEDLLKIDKKN